MIEIFLTHSCVLQSFFFFFTAGHVGMQTLKGIGKFVDFAINYIEPDTNPANFPVQNDSKMGVTRGIKTVSQFLFIKFNIDFIPY